MKREQNLSSNTFVTSNQFQYLEIPIYTYFIRRTHNYSLILL